MNRTIKEATVKRYHYDSHDQLRRHLSDFVDAYDFGRRLKSLKGLTPYEFVCRCWTTEPKRFKLDQLQKMPGLNTGEAFRPVRSPSQLDRRGKVGRLVPVVLGEHGLHSSGHCCRTIAA